MVTPELLSFVQAEIKAGKPVDQIKSELLAAGWQEQDVTEAFNQAKAGGTAKGALPFNKKYIFIGGGVFIVIILIFVVVLAVSSKKSDNQTTQAPPPTPKVITKPSPSPAPSPNLSPTLALPTVTVNPTSSTLPTCPSGLKSCVIKGNSCPFSSPYECTNGTQDICCENP